MIKEGTITDNEGQPLHMANVVVRNADMEVVDGTTTNSDGDYSIEIPDTLDGTAEVSFIGFAPVIVDVMDLGSHQMSVSEQVLGEAVIESELDSPEPPVERKRLSPRVIAILALVALLVGIVIYKRFKNAGK